MIPYMQWISCRRNAIYIYNAFRVAGKQARAGDRTDSKFLMIFFFKTVQIVDFHYNIILIHHGQYIQINKYRYA